VDAKSRRVTVVSRSDGSPVWNGAFKTQSEIVPDGVAAAHGRLHACTQSGEVVCMAP
jgi:hypothetical protein